MGYLIIPILILQEIQCHVLVCNISYLPTAERRPVEVLIEFRLENPTGGVHFVVPPGKGSMLQVSLLILAVLSVYGCRQCRGNCEVSVTYC